MTRRRKILAYAVGFVLGCLILLAIPREGAGLKRHPWHAQTAPDGTYPMRLSDDYGRQIVLEGQPRHLVSLAPSITEILFEMGMGDHLLAVTESCDYPTEARFLRDSGASIGPMAHPDLDLIATYTPDLVIGSTSTPLEIYSALERAAPKTTTLALRQEDMEDVQRNIATIGTALGVPGKALALIQKVKAGEATIRNPGTSMPEKESPPPPGKGLAQ